LLMEYSQKGRVRLSALHLAAKKDDVRSALLLLQNNEATDQVTVQVCHCRRVDSAFDSCLKDTDSNPTEAGHCVTTVGKLFTPTVPSAAEGRHFLTWNVLPDDILIVADFLYSDNC